MKLKTLLIGCYGGFIMLNSCTESPSVKDYSAYVNPFIGTGGHGHTFPGAVVPHGMIQQSGHPDRRLGRLLRLLLRRQHDQRFFAYPRQRYRLL